MHHAVNHETSWLFCKLYAVYVRSVHSKKSAIKRRVRDAEFQFTTMNIMFKNYKINMAKVKNVNHFSDFELRICGMQALDFGNILSTIQVVHYTIHNIYGKRINMSKNISNCTKIKHLSTENSIFCILITLNALGCVFLMFSYFFCECVNVWLLSIKSGCSLVVNATCNPILNVKCLYRKYMRIMHSKRNFCFLFYKVALQLINWYLCKIRYEMQYRHPNTKLITRITFADNWLVRYGRWWWRQIGIRQILSIYDRCLHFICVSHSINEKGIRTFSKQLRTSFRCKFGMINLAKTKSIVIF